MADGDHVFILIVPVVLLYCRTYPLPLRSLLATTGRSVPALRIGTLALAGPPLGLLPWHRRAGSHVPSRSLRRVPAACMQATTWSVNRHLPGSSRANDYLSVLMASLRLRHFISGSLVFVSIGAYLTKSRCAFSRNAHHHGFSPAATSQSAGGFSYPLSVPSTSASANSG